MKINLKFNNWSNNSDKTTSVHPPECYISERRHRLELMKVDSLHSGLPAWCRIKHHSNRRGEISNNIIGCMINTILESVHSKSPLHNFLTTFITIISSTRYNNYFIITTTQHKGATWNATRYYAHACGTNRAKPST